MRIVHAISAAFVLVLVACGQAAAPTDAEAQPTGQAAAPAAGAEITDADKAAILRAIGLAAANAQGDVMNECGELSTPQYVIAPLGGGAGNGILFAMGGGPTTASCYGDGHLLYLFVRDGAGLRQVYDARGRVFVLMTSTTNGVRDIVDGGPGFSFPLWTWNGTTYEYNDRTVADSALGDATFLP
ncbi:MAG: hypothetical protein AB7O98_17965 [Hyphomonadaceae bacterium]